LSDVFVVVVATPEQATDRAVHLGPHAIVKRSGCRGVATLECEEELGIVE
jgi:hypothetical protein